MMVRCKDLEQFVFLCSEFIREGMDIEANAEELTIKVLGQNPECY